VPLVLLKAGRPFELIDISAESLCVDHSLVLDRWNASSAPAPAGLVYVRTYGSLTDTSEFFLRLRAINPAALLIDDRCLCAPRFEPPDASDADVLLYSTGYAKFVDIGFGGYGLLRDGVRYVRRPTPFAAAHLDELTAAYKEAIAARRPLRYHDTDWLDCRDPPMPWERYRQTVQAAVEASTSHKQTINAVYSSGLPPEIQLPARFQGWRFNINVRDKSRLLSAINAAGLFASGHYDSLATLFDGQGGRVAKDVHSNVINLFNDFYFDEPRAHKLVDVLLAAGATLAPGSTAIPGAAAPDGTLDGGSRRP
jgi:hypothetical protein